MPFSQSFSASFNKEESAQSPNIGTLTIQFHNAVGEKNMGQVLEEFNVVMGEWKIGDFQ